MRESKRGRRLTEAPEQITELTRAVAVAGGGLRQCPVVTRHGRTDEWK